MASAGAGTFFARPAYVAGEKERFRNNPVNGTNPANAQGQRIVKKHARFASDLESSEPPPRPPPPRPCRAPIKHADHASSNGPSYPSHGSSNGGSTRAPISGSNYDSNSGPNYGSNSGPNYGPKSGRPSHAPNGGSGHAPEGGANHRPNGGENHGPNGRPGHGHIGGANHGHERKRQLPATPDQPRHHVTHEPKPLTRTNVTSHERLWQKDADSEHTGGVSDILSPPLQYITPETTEEMFRNFDPMDIMDGMSEHSDSSADTMIMMTTEEEQKNQEKINKSMKQFTSKTKPERQDTNRIKGSMQAKKNLHIHFADTNGLSLDDGWRRKPVMGGASPAEQTYSKVVPLHITTDNHNHVTSPENTAVKTNGNHGSPNDSPDDGYGTNSSSGTVSSPFSSSFGSNDFENSYNGNSKKVILPNGAIKPNSVRESWAVKRKQRMIEAQDNSVQEQLRELTVIEEEGAKNMVARGSSGKGPALTHDKNLNRPTSGQYKPSEKTVLRKDLPSAPGQAGHRRHSDDDQSCVNVSQNDLRRINQQLFVMSNERDAIQGNTRRRSERSLPQTPSSNEINSAARVPPPHSQFEHETYSLPHARTNRVSDEVFSSLPTPGTDMNGLSDTQGVYNWEDESDISATTGPMLLRGGAEQKYRTASGSGKIYLSPTGDEGFYSLNRSSRSTSVSSFQPINEVFEPGPEQTEPGPSEDAPRSPLEALSGDLLEKWSDMDRNYRNYYGFDENTEKYSRTDSKVNYFQEKKINTMYGQDNYYQPQNYGSEPALHQGQRQNQGQSSSQGIASQGTRSDSSKDKDSAVAGSSKSGTKSHSKSGKDKDSSSSKSKLFQILPNMFKPSSKKQNGDSSKDSKGGNKSGHVKVPVIIEAAPGPSELAVTAGALEDYEPEAEYINMSDLPQYSVANVEYEEKLRKGQFVSLENLNKRPVFASSRDIKKLFSHLDQSFDSIQSPGTQRHSFHAMPLSYRHKVNMNPAGGDDDMRPRAHSTNATMRSQQLQNSVESRMALIARKNASVMSQARQAQLEENKAANVSFHSNNSSSNQKAGSRSRLNSGDSSGGDSKLSTLV